MFTEKIEIEGIPAILSGEKSDNVYLFVHGKNGSAEESLDFAEIACPAGFQVIGIDLPEHGSRKNSEEKFIPQTAVAEIEKVYLYLKNSRKNVFLRANSIGAWFSMHALKDKEIKRALFVSPVVDMEALIKNMMVLSHVSMAELEQEKEIPTDFGETLSWEYLCWVKNHPVSWKIPTEILYAEKDNLTSKDIICSFAEANGCKLTVMKDGEHWFHTEKQLRFMRNWETENLK